MDFYNSIYKNKYAAYQAAKWYQKNLKNSPKTVEKLTQDIAKFEDDLQEEHQKMLNKCPHCKIEMQIFSPNTVGCTKCGLASPRLIPMDYHQFTKSYQEPTKQTFNQEKHFIQWVYNLLGINKPKEDIMPILWKYIEQNNISMVSVESLRLILKRLKKAKYYKYTAYFYKELTGVGPPFIPRDIINRAKWYFNNFNRAREKLVVEGKLPKNNPQYLYLIYKIFDIILDKDDKEKRRILHFIHLPAKSTLLKREREWNLICKDQIKP